MRTFRIERYEDPSGMSGTGVVAEGVLFSDGKCITRWLGDRASVHTWDNLGVDDVIHIHSHGGTADTRLVWNDNLVPAQREALSDADWEFIRGLILSPNLIPSPTRRRELIDRIQDARGLPHVA